MNEGQLLITAYRMLSEHFRREGSLDLDSLHRTLRSMAEEKSAFPPRRAAAMLTSIVLNNPFGTLSPAVAMLRALLELDDTGWEWRSSPAELARKLHTLRDSGNAEDFIKWFEQRCQKKGSK